MFFETGKESIDLDNGLTVEEEKKEIAKILFGMFSPSDNNFNHYCNNLTDVFHCAMLCKFDFRAKLGEFGTPTVNYDYYDPDELGNERYDKLHKFIVLRTTFAVVDKKSSLAVHRPLMVSSGYECYLKHVLSDKDLTLKALEIYGEMVFDYFKVGVCFTINNSDFKYSRYSSSNKRINSVHKCLWRMEAEDCFDERSWWNPSVLSSDYQSPGFCSFGNYLNFCECAADIIDDGFGHSWKGHFDPILLFTLAKLKEVGYKNIIKQDQNEANFFYYLAFFGLATDYFDFESNRIMEHHPYYDYYYDFECDQVMEQPSLNSYFKENLFLSGDEIFKDILFTGDKWDYKKASAIFDNLMENAICYERNHESQTANPLPPLSFIHEKIGSQKSFFEGLKREIIGGIGLIYLKRKDYEKAASCFEEVCTSIYHFDDVLGRDKIESWLDKGRSSLGCRRSSVLLEQSELDGSILCDRVWISKLALCAYAEIRMLERNNLSPSSEEYEDLTGDIDFLFYEFGNYYLEQLGFYNWHFPIEADLHFPAIDPTYESIRYSRDIYIWCQQRSLRAKSFNFESIGYSFLNQQRPSYKNIATICEIIKKREEREPNDELFLRLFDEKAS